MWDVILLSRNRFYYGCCLRRSLTDAEYPQLLNSITTFIPRQLPLAWQMRTQGTPTTVCRGHMHCLPAPSPAAAGRGTLWHQKTVQWKPYNFAISCILHRITAGRTTEKLLSLFTPLTAKWIYLKSLFFFSPQLTQRNYGIELNASAFIHLWFLFQPHPESPFSDLELKVSDFGE